MSDWAVVGMLVVCCLCLAGVYWTGIERGKDLGYIEGREDAEALFDLAPEEPYAGRSVPRSVPTDPRPGARGSAHVRPSEIVSPWLPEDDWRYPDADS